jgi:hypothetical protein
MVETRIAPRYRASKAQLSSSMAALLIAWFATCPSVHYRSRTNSLPSRIPGKFMLVVAATWPSIRSLRLRPPASPPPGAPSTRCAKSLGFWSVATVGPSILTRSPISLGSALPNLSLFFLRASIYSRPSFLGCPPVARSLLTATHCVSPLVAENQLG